MNKKTNWKLSGVILLGLIIALVLIMSNDAINNSCNQFEMGQEVNVTSGEYEEAIGTVLDYGNSGDLIIYFEGFTTQSIPCENLE